jgi:putative phage-type endonuclease
MTIEQGSAEWFALRCGKVTASRIADLMAKPKEPGKGMRANYLTQLAVERVTGVPGKTYQNAVMEEAHEWEPKARAFYAFRNGAEVQQVAFIDHYNIPMAGCSPDGLVGAAGLVEFKCPIQTTHYNYLRRGADAVDSGYLKQIQFQMACDPSRKFCDFVSYNDDFPEHKRGLIIRVPRHDGMIAEIEEAVRVFQAEVEQVATWLRDE